jgi:ribose-phosphate pyrophosphokinase
MINATPFTTLNLSNPADSDIKFKRFAFPDGTPHLAIDTEALSIRGLLANARILIRARVRSMSDFMDILLANDALRRFGFEYISLWLPAFPGARQDRVCVPGEPLTVKVFAELVNACAFDDVYIMTPHSDVTPALIDRVRLMEYDAEHIRIIIDRMKWNLHELHGINIIYPDAGSAKRIDALIKKVLDEYDPSDPAPKLHLIKCEKSRDLATGKLDGFLVMADDLGGRPSLIIDDVIAYGGTFIGLAKKLREKNSGPITLYTSHADCTAGLLNVANELDFVISTNSHDFFDADPEIMAKPNISIFKL